MDDRTKTEAWPGQQARPASPPNQVPPSRGGRVGRILFGFLLIAAAVGTAWWFYHRPEPANARRGRTQTPPVATAPVASGDINVTINALGTVTSLATVTIKSQISGQLIAVNFQEGQLVKKGDLLAEIDSDRHGDDYGGPQR